MGDTSETNTKVLSRELFLGVVALKTPITQNHNLRDKVPFLKSGHIYMLSVCRSISVVCQINCVGGITCSPRAYSKYFLAVYARALAWTKKKLKLAP